MADDEDFVDTTTTDEEELDEEEELENVIVDNGVEVSPDIKAYFINCIREIGRDACGELYVEGIVPMPNIHRDPDSREVHGFTAVVRQSTPISPAVAKLIGSRLESGVALFEIEVPKGASIEDIKNMSHTVNASVSERVSEGNDFDIFGDNNRAWTPSLGTGRYNMIDIDFETNSFKKGEYWVLTVSATLEYSSERLIRHAIDNDWTIETLYNSTFMKKLRRASALNRSMIAIKAAESVNAKITVSKHAINATDYIEVASSVSDNAYDTIVVSRKFYNPDEKSHFELYAIHNHTYPTNHIHDKFVVRLRNKGGIMIITKTTGGDWTNASANSFPIDTGMTGLVPTYKRNPLLWFPHMLVTTWESLLNFNPLAQPDAYRPFNSSFEKSLSSLGMRNDWKIEPLATVVVKVSSMDTKKIAAEQLLDCADDNGYVTIDVDNKNLRILLKNYKYVENPPPLRELFANQIKNKYVRIKADDLRRLVVTAN